MIPITNIYGGRRHPFGKVQGRSHLFPTDEEKEKTAQAWVKERNRLLARHNEHRKDHGLDLMPAERAQRFVQPPSELEAYIFSRYRANRGFNSPLKGRFNRRDRFSAQEDYYELLTEAYGDAEEWEKVYADEWAKLFKGQVFGRRDERRNVRAQFCDEDDEDDDEHEDFRMPRGIGEPVDGAGSVGGRPGGMHGPGGNGPRLFGEGFDAGFGSGRRHGRR
ncbi:hypothetical protein BKA58DRAFT_442486 [Alternaria rosae]|uniref:uncharacterized protein n=1 Tax=Alternaria rosae TaxID=1187941 RepID=UPI001E8EEEE5|nr:uncharacterized protein BKA58DRAFT_442486 [Alternaria rosae]KAH6865712.1 hypothetical protein BKA58DRAFT_442486 [Alternaria rosae]